MPTTNGNTPPPDDWCTRLGDKLVSADDAVRGVKSGDLVRLPMGPVPVTLVNALARRRDELRAVRVWQGATRHPLPWATAESGWEGHIDFVTDFLSVLLRPAMDARRADFAVTDYSIGAKVLEHGRRARWSAELTILDTRSGRVSTCRSSTGARLKANLSRRSFAAIRRRSN